MFKTTPQLHTTLIKFDLFKGLAYSLGTQLGYQR